MIVLDFITFIVEAIKIFLTLVMYQVATITFISIKAFIDNEEVIPIDLKMFVGY